MNDQDKIAYQAEIARLNETIKWYQGQAGQRIGEAARAGIAGAPASVPPVTLSLGWIHDGDAAFNPATGERRPYDFPPAAPLRVQPDLSKVAHPDDLAVDHTAAAMKAKMAVSRAKGRDGWDNPALCSVEELAYMLIEHAGKGDAIDVANFAMMLHNRGADHFALSEAMGVYLTKNAAYALTPEELDAEVSGAAPLPAQPDQKQPQQDDFGQKVTDMIGEIRKAKTLAWRDSLVEKLIELIEPSPQQSGSIHPSAEPAGQHDANIDTEAIGWAYLKLLAYGAGNTNPLMLDRLNMMLLGDAREE